MNTFHLASGWPPSKTFQHFSEAELLAFISILFAAGVHRQNKENLDVMRKGDASPLIRATMSRDRFKMMLRFTTFDNKNTRAERAQTDKAAPIRDMCIMLNRNLEKAYKPYECLTIDEQLFRFRGHTKFTEYILSKPAKYVIKVFWACGASHAYPVQDQIYTGKPIDGPRQVNVGKRTVLNLVSLYKSSGRNLTMDNFFANVEFAKILNFWNMTLVGTVRKKQNISAQQHAAHLKKGLFIQPILPTIVMQQSVHMCERRRKQLCFCHLCTCREKLKKHNQPSQR